MRVRYATNTLGGSSGSPCFNFDWDLIALHHYGDPSYNHPKYNQGIPIGLIRERLRRQGKDQALEGDNP
jgi:V8-like Glu-specific endopeptidase